MKWEKKVYEARHYILTVYLIHPLDVMFEVPRQDNLVVLISCNAIHDATIARAEITEQVHDLFSANIFLRTNKSQNLVEILNQTATIAIQEQGTVLRYFHGIIDNVSIETVPKANIIENLLFIHIVPTIARLNYSRNYHIWLEKSAREIIEEILKINNISDYKFVVPKYNNKKLNMCVQYGESDLYFICRLLEENGIFYYIQHSNKADTFVMSDSSIAGDRLSNSLFTINTHSQDLYPLNGSQNVSIAHSIASRIVHHKAYNYTKASVVNSVYQNLEPQAYGSSNYYDNVYDEKPEGDTLCQILLEEANVSAKNLSAITYCPFLYPGAITVLNDKEYFILSVKHTIDQLGDNPEAPIYKNSFESIPRDTVFRPANTHKKMRIWGCQTATVVGKENEKINCDETGRVQVHFHWAKDVETSCWVRVGTLWAGNNFGALVIPRVGMEVIVSFVNGDPDQPLITGCVYNGRHMPPGKYPSKKTVSTFYTNSVGTDGFNELRFDDTGNNEEIYIHAQKHLNKLVENSVTEILNSGSKTVTLNSNEGTVTHSLLIKNGNKITTIDRGNKTVILKKGDSTITLEEGNSEITLSSGKSTITIASGDRTITLESGNQKITLSNGDLIINVTGSTTIETSKDLTIRAGRNISIEAGANISVKTTSGYYSLKALTVNINATTICDIKSTDALNLNTDALSAIATGTFSAQSNMEMVLSSSIIMNLTAPRINLN